MYITESFVCICVYSNHWVKLKTPVVPLTLADKTLYATIPPTLLSFILFSRIDRWDEHGTCYTLPSIPSPPPLASWIITRTCLDPCWSTSTSNRNVCVTIPFNRVRIHRIHDEFLAKGFSIVMYTVVVGWTWQRRPLFALFAPVCVHYIYYYCIEIVMECVCSIHTFDTIKCLVNRYLAEQNGSRNRYKMSVCVCEGKQPDQIIWPTIGLARIDNISLNLLYFNICDYVPNQIAFYHLFQVGSSAAI